MQRRHEPNACVWKSETNASSTSANDMASSTQKRRSLGSFMMDDPSCFFNISTNTFTTSSLLVPAFPNVSSSNVDGDVCVVEEEMLSMRMVLAARPIAASFILSPTVLSITSFNICGGGHQKHTRYIYSMETSDLCESKGHHYTCVLILLEYQDESSIIFVSVFNNLGCLVYRNS